MAGLAGDQGFAQSELVESQSLGSDAKTGAIKMRVSRAVNRLVEAEKLTERDGRYYLPEAF